MNHSPPRTRGSAASLITIAGALTLTTALAITPVPALAIPAHEGSLSLEGSQHLSLNGAVLDRAESKLLALRKCPLLWDQFPDAPMTGLVVDGVLVSEGHSAVRSLMVPGANAPGAEHPWGRILEARLMCGEELYDRTGIAVRNHAIVIHTEEGPVAPVITFLSELAERQQAHFEVHGRFADTPTELDWVPEADTRSITILLSNEALGWTAIAVVEGYPSTCGVFGGSAAPLAARATENTPLCPVARR